jgi:predicted transcriptional regulator
VEESPLDFGVIERAGITQGEVAALLGVSRVTVNKYCMGHAQPHSLISKRVGKFLALLESRLAEGKLPIAPSDVRHEQREARLASIRAALQ